MTSENARLSLNLRTDIDKFFEAILLWIKAY